MTMGRQLPLCASLLLALCVLAPSAAAQQLGGGPRVTPLMGNDGVGGIEWQLPRDAPSKPGFKQSGDVLLPPPPQNLPGPRPSPVSVGSSGANRTLARSLPGGREGMHGELQLTPLADLNTGKLTALALSGARAGAPAWLLVGSSAAATPLAGGLLGFSPERMVPLGPVGADGELLVRLPECLELEGLLFQVVVRERNWASSRPLMIEASLN